MTYTSHKIFRKEFCGRELVIETGKFSQLANGACLVRYGETVVNVAVTASKKPREGIDFFPLSVDFEEKLYSVGKIPGSFLKREGRPSERATLTSRLIDRPIRPLFPKDMRNDVSVVCSAFSIDPNCPAEIAAIIGASISLAISDIPWFGPISAVNVGMIDGEFVYNPTNEQKSKSDLFLTVSSIADVVGMIEAQADQIDNETMLNAIMNAHEINKELIEFIRNIKKEVGKEKFDYPKNEINNEFLKTLQKTYKEEIKAAVVTKDKSLRDKNLFALELEIKEKFAESYPEEITKIPEYLYIAQKILVRTMLFDDKERVDGRGLNEIRKLGAEVALLPRVHGSAMFCRGQTQVLTAATLGPMSDKQTLDGIDGETEKRYMHHYNFPPFSVGEARPSRGPGRREIGHGALAEKALIPVLPRVEDFPYAIRLVSEVLSSNGSTSQGAVCASTLALMDAGVPIKAPVAGISCGLIKNGEDFLTMVDIQGIEDFFGDMDFKVAGTKKGITAIQMDLKITGLTEEIIKEALEKTYAARLEILDETMLKALPEPRAELSKYAPKMLTTCVPVDKIKDVIGSGGKVVQKICADYEVRIDIEEDGRVFVCGEDMDKCKAARSIVESIVKEAKVGEIYNGKVVRIMDFGAFVEIAPGKDGLCHISQLDKKRVNKVTDVVNIGDNIIVKVTGVDDKGRINLSCLID